MYINPQSIGDIIILKDITLIKYAVTMKHKEYLWYKLLTTGKRELGWEYGLSIPFLVGAYSHKMGIDYCSLDGIKQILNEIVAASEEDVAIMNCTKYNNITVYTIQVLSEIPKATAKNIKENAMIADNIYLTIKGVKNIETLAENLWNIYKLNLSKQEFSAQKDVTCEYWRVFNEEEKNMIDNL